MSVISSPDFMFSSLLVMMLIWLSALKFEAKMLAEPDASEVVSNDPELMLMLFAETRFEAAREV